MGLFYFSRFPNFTHYMCAIVKTETFLTLIEGIY
jgi:hypothetical protein